MVKNEHQLQSIPWDNQSLNQQPLDYYMNVPTANSYSNVNLLINNNTNNNRVHCNGPSQMNVEPKMSPIPAVTPTTPVSGVTVPTSTPKSRPMKSSSPLNDFNSSNSSQHKEIYPWMSDKKHGTNKTKPTSKTSTGHNTTSTSSSSSSSGKH